MDGVAADKVIGKEGGARPDAVLRAIGDGLASLHSVPVLEGSSLRTIEVGGGCDVRMHVNNEILPVLKSSPHSREHKFLPFYERQLVALQEGMALTLPRGVLHGDPFLDNVLVSPEDGSLRGFVDMEDVTVGPLLFDLACCASACCFQADNTLDLERLTALLEAYKTVRPLEQLEKLHFVAFMRLTMLCNCAWRFKHFNIDHREAEECRDSYLELQLKIEHLEIPAVVTAIEGLVG